MVDGESATVTVATRGLDMASSLDTQFETIGGQITADTEGTAIIAVLDKAWREASLVPKPTNVEMPFTAVSDGRWIADAQGGAVASAAYVKFGDWRRQSTALFRRRRVSVGTGVRSGAFTWMV